MRALSVCGIWAAVFAVAFAILFSSGYQSWSGDSRYYNRLVAQLDGLPLSRWIAPRWGENFYGQPPDAYFRDHPIGHYVPAALLVRLGVPAEHALHCVNLVSQVLSLYLMVALAAHFVGRERAWIVLWGLQIVPVALSHGVRANHEQTMLLGALLSLYGAVRMADHLKWTLLVVLGTTWALLVKGLLALMVPLWAAVAFALVVGREDRARLLRGLAALAVGGAWLALVAVGYELGFRAVTGEGFAMPYLGRQVADRVWHYPGEQSLLLRKLEVLWYYANRHLVYALPWSLLALVGLLWRSPAPAAPDPDLRRLCVVLGSCVLTTIAALTGSNHYASRYAYPSFFLAASLFLLLAAARWVWLARLQRQIARLGVHVTAAALWLSLFLLHLRLRFHGEFSLSP